MTIDQQDVLVHAMAGRAAAAYEGLAEKAVRQALRGDFSVDHLSTELGPLRLAAYNVGGMVAAVGIRDAEDELDLDDDEAVDVIRFERWAQGGPMLLRLRHGNQPRPHVAAIDALMRKRAITRDAWDALDNRLKAQAFTIARVASAQTIQAAQRALGQLMAAGVAERKVPGLLREQMRAQGHMGDGTLAPWHAKLVFRNAAHRSYAEAHAVHGTQDHVAQARPVWRVVSANDERSRATHKAAHGKAMLKSDPGWQRTYPPFGHNCRCRVRSVRGGANHEGPLTNLPDRGWTTTPPPVVTVDLKPRKPPPKPRGSGPRNPRPRKPRRMPTPTALREAEVDRLQPLGIRSANETSIAHLVETDGTKRKAIFKPADGESFLRQNVPQGRYHFREQACAEVDKLMGGKTLVPATVSRAVNGRVGSVQAWDDVAKPYHKLDPYDQLAVQQKLLLDQVRQDKPAHPAAVRQTLLDVITGNTDRHSGNTLYKLRRHKKTGAVLDVEMVAIDNGLTFPTSALGKGLGYDPRLPQPIDSEASMQRTLAAFADKKAQALLKRLTPAKMAKTLRASGIEREAAQAAMVRAEALKAMPDVINKSGSDDGSGRAFSKVTSFWRLSHERPRALVPDGAYAAIQRALVKAYGQ